MFGFTILQCGSLLIVFIFCWKCRFTCHFWVQTFWHVDRGQKMPESTFVKEIQSVSSTKLDVNGVFLTLGCHLRNFTISWTNCMLIWHIAGNLKIKCVCFLFRQTFLCFFFFHPLLSSFINLCFFKEQFESSSHYHEGVKYVPCRIFYKYLLLIALGGLMRLVPFLYAAYFKTFMVLRL